MAKGKTNRSQDSYAPPFTVSAKAISLVAEISALVERYAIRLEQPDALRLRRVNKIKTIHSSLAIEGNTLSENQVSELLNGKRVVAPIRQIQEVKNAIATYDLIEFLDPFSIQDLLKAHKTLMTALVGKPGTFRPGGVGVFADKKMVHMAPPANRVPTLMADLFEWLANAEDHLLIRSCVFHYEFEFIHPFSDGNGRMGRLWQSLILGRLHKAFLSLPVETIIHHNQQDYYDAINTSSSNADCGAFIDFMLDEILQALKANQDSSEMPGGGVNGGVNGGVTAVVGYIEKHPGHRANIIATSLGLPLRSVQRYLSQLKSSGKIEFRGAPRKGGYYFIGSQ